MQTSFVILTRDRWSRLHETVARLRENHPDVPIVVVDNGSAWSPAGVDGALLLNLEHDHGAAARNAGVEATDTELVAFCDDDAWWEPGALEACEARFAEDPRLGAVAARVVVEPGGRLDPVSAAHEREGQVTGFLATGLVIRREAFVGVGGFHRRFRIGGEEELMAMTLLAIGWRLAYEPEAVVHHAPAPKSDRHRVHRPATESRNQVWTAWLRRPLPVAARETARVVRERPSPRLVASVAAGLPWVLRERLVNPPDVEALYADEPEP